MVDRRENETEGQQEKPVKEEIFKMLRFALFQCLVTGDECEDSIFVVFKVIGE